MVEGGTSGQLVYEGSLLPRSLLFPLGWTNSPYWLSSGQLQVHSLSTYIWWEKLHNILDSRAPGVLRVAGMRPSHVLPNPSLVVGFLKPCGAHLSKLPQCLWCVQPGVRMGGQASVRDKGESLVHGRQAVSPFFPSGEADFCDGGHGLRLPV